MAVFTKQDEVRKLNERLEGENQQLRKELDEARNGWEEEKKRREVEVGEKWREISEIEEKLSTERYDKIRLERQVEEERASKTRYADRADDYQRRADDEARRADIEARRADDEARKNEGLTSEMRQLKELKRQLEGDNIRLWEENGQLKDFKEECVAIVTGERVDKDTITSFTQSVAGDKLQMHVAVHLGIKWLVDLLKENRRPLNTRNNRGWTPLHLATALGNTSMMDRLWDSEKELYNDPLVLHIAAANRQFLAAKYLKPRVDKTIMFKQHMACQVSRLEEHKPLARKIEPHRIFWCIRKGPKNYSLRKEEIDELKLHPPRRTSGQPTRPPPPSTSALRSYEPGSLSKKPLLTSDNEPNDGDLNDDDLNDQQQSGVVSHYLTQEEERTQEETEMEKRKRENDYPAAAREEGERRPKRSKRVVRYPAPYHAHPTLLQAVVTLPKGLPNLGNTCYMNSVLQCLYYTTKLSQRLREDEVTRGEVWRSIRKVMTGLHRRENLKEAVMMQFKTVVAEKDIMYEDFDQKEAHDFLCQLVEWLHEEMVQEDGEATDTDAESFISKLFNGTHLSTITCKEKAPDKVICKNFESFSNLSLTITYPTTLEEALVQQYRVQELRWDCTRCDMEHSCEHKVSLTKSPPVLVLHLNRSGQNQSSVEKDKVLYPASLDIKLTNGESRKYSLFALCCHSGNMSSGHYTAYCRSGDNWYYFNDRNVTVARVEDVYDRNSAHILFYKVEE